MTEIPPSPFPDPALDRERCHHDQWAGEIDIAAVSPEAHFEGSTSPENRFILSKLGGLKGKRILDLGCGAGENSVYFAKQGASCVAADISPGMVKTALRLAELHRATIEAVVANVLQLDFPDDSFDIVYAANVLHHVDPFRALLEIRRVLKPGGTLCFWDPLKHNPVINIYRRIAKEVRSRDERPLNISIVKQARALFRTVQYDTFWLATLWIFVRFYFIERIDPNRERYWKKIILEEGRLRPLYLRLERIDKLLKTLPFLKRYAWNIAVVASK